MKNKEVWVNIPNDIAKGNRGRKFNLLVCGDALKKHIQGKDPEDYLFLNGDLKKINMFNKKLQKACVQLFGNKVSDTRAKGLWSEITLRDMRHSGAIYLRILSSKNGKISLDAIRERGGWSDFEMLNYYTKFIGLTGRIDKGELVTEQDKSRMEIIEQSQKEMIAGFGSMQKEILELREKLEQQQLNNPIAVIKERKK